MQCLKLYCVAHCLLKMLSAYRTANTFDKIYLPNQYVGTKQFLLDWPIRANAKAEEISVEFEMIFWSLEFYEIFVLI